MNHRVVITGLGAVTPIGNTVEEFLKMSNPEYAVLILSLTLILRTML